MEFPVTINSQDEFDGFVKDRIARVEAKFSDYDELKAKASQVDAVKAEADKALADAIARAEQAEGKVSEYETKTQVETWRAEVAKAAGVPADVLRGSTKEDFEAHAAILKPLITGSGPVIPHQGVEPEKPAVNDERAAVQALFGYGGD